MKGSLTDHLKSKMAHGKNVDTSDNRTSSGRRATVAGRSYTRRETLGGALALALTPWLTGCSSVLRTSKEAATAGPTPNSSNPQPTPSGSISNAALTVAKTAIGTIPDRFLGFSAEKNALYGSLYSGTNTKLIALYSMLGQHSLRLGGATVDACDWTPLGSGKTAGQIAPSDVDRLASFLSATGYNCIYGTNFAGTNSTPTLAAEESAYVYDSLGGVLSSMEIGNEPDSYGNSGSYFPGNWSLSQFESRWSLYRNAMIALRSSLPISGPAGGGNVSTWTVPFAQYATGREINLLTQHYYRFTSASGTPTAATLVNPEPDATLGTMLSAVKGGADAISVPFRIAECNSVSRGGTAGVSNVYASTLWGIDYLFQCALAGAVGVNFHSTTSATGYTPIATSNGNVISVQPLFYGMYFFSTVGTGTLYQTSLSGNNYTTAYAVKGTTLKIIVVNKDASNHLNLTINLYKAVRYATLIQLTQLSTGASSASLTATDGITIQGSSIGVDGTFTPGAAYTLTPGSSQLNCYVPSLTAVMIEIV